MYEENENKTLNETNPENITNPENTTNPTNTTNYTNETASSAGKQPQENSYSTGDQYQRNTYSTTGQQYQGNSSSSGAQQYYTGSQRYSNHSTNQYSGNQGQPKKKRYAGKIAAVIALLLVIGLAGAGGLYGVYRVLSNQPSRQVSVSTTTDNTDEINDITTVSNSITAVVTDVSQVVENTMPSVVSISNVGTQQYTNMFGQTGTYASESSGSGIIIGQNDSELLVVTNQHVVEGADTLSVGFIDNKTATADVKGSDSSYDIAVIAISKSDLSEETLNNIKIATLGDSNSLKVGEPAIAIGNALGYGQSVTVGVISALNRDVTVEESTNKLIQTDAAINPGNSGGALMNMAGEVIGINSVKYADTEVEGMGYAIPISDVSSLIDELMNRETKKKVSDGEQSYLGISCVDVTSNVARTYNMPQGVYVAQVEENGAAQKAGIEKGDIITKLDDSTITSYTELTQELQYHSAGTKVTVVVQHPIESGYGYEERTFEVELGKKTDSNN